MRAKSLFIAAFLLSTSSLPAFAGTTPDDAAKLKAVLQGYFGRGADALKIVPAGDGYKVSIDSTAMTKAAQSNGIDFSFQPYDFDLTPLGGGKWKIHNEGPFSAAVKMKDQMDISEKAEVVMLDGEFDEALGAFTTLNASAKNLAVKELIVDPKGTTINADLKYDNIETTMTGTASAGGGVDLKIAYKIGHGDLIEDISATGEPPLHLVIATDAGSADGTITGVKSLAMLQLFKFFAAHNSKELIGKDQAAFKTLLTDLLPGFGTMDAKGNLGKTTVQTPLGTFGIEKVGVTFAGNGAVKEGKFSEGLSLEGLTMPPSLVPAWASSLVTKNTSVTFGLSGFDLESAGKAFIAAADFTKDPPVPVEVGDSLLSVLLPKGIATITLSNTVISNDTYKITVDGTVDAGPTAKPTGKAHITAKGLDDIMKAIQAAPPEMGMQGGAAVIVVAKGMGKAESDGSISWDVEATPDGKINVNGIDVSQMAK